MEMMKKKKTNESKEDTEVIRLNKSKFSYY